MRCIASETWAKNHWSECGRATSVGNSDALAARIAQFWR